MPLVSVKGGKAVNSFHVGSVDSFVTPLEQPLVLTPNTTVALRAAKFEMLSEMYEINSSNDTITVLYNYDGGETAPPATSNLLPGAVSGITASATINHGYYSGDDLAQAVQGALNASSSSVSIQTGKQYVWSVTFVSGIGPAAGTAKFVIDLIAADAAATLENKDVAPRVGVFFGEQHDAAYRFDNINDFTGSSVGISGGVHLHYNDALGVIGLENMNDVFTPTQASAVFDAAANADLGITLGGTIGWQLPWPRNNGTDPSPAELSMHLKSKPKVKSKLDDNNMFVDSQISIQLIGISQRNWTKLLSKFPSVQYPNFLFSDQSFNDGLGTDELHGIGFRLCDITFHQDMVASSTGELQRGEYTVEIQYNKALASNQKISNRVDDINTLFEGLTNDMAASKTYTIGSRSNILDDSFHNLPVTFKVTPSVATAGNNLVNSWSIGLNIDKTNLDLVTNAAMTDPSWDNNNGASLLTLDNPDTDDLPNIMIVPIIRLDFTPVAGSYPSVDVTPLERINWIEEIKQSFWNLATPVAVMGAVDTIIGPDAPDVVDSTEPVSSVSRRVSFLADDGTTVVTGDAALKYIVDIMGSQAIDVSSFEDYSEIEIALTSDKWVDLFQYMDLMTGSLDVPGTAFTTDQDKYLFCPPLRITHGSQTLYRDPFALEAIDYAYQAVQFEDYNAADKVYKMYPGINLVSKDLNPQGIQQTTFGKRILDEGLHTLIIRVVKQPNADLVHVAFPFIENIIQDVPGSRTTPFTDNPDYTTTLDVTITIRHVDGPVANVSAGFTTPFQHVGPLKTSTGTGLFRTGYHPALLDASSEPVLFVSTDRYAATGDTFVGTYLYLDGLCDTMGFYVPAVQAIASQSDDGSSWIPFTSAAAQVESNIETEKWSFARTNLAVMLKNIPIQAVLSNGQVARVVAFLDEGVKGGEETSVKIVDGKAQFVDLYSWVPQNLTRVQLNTTQELRVTSLDIALCDSSGLPLASSRVQPLLSLELLLDFFTPSVSDDAPFTKRARLE
eukprot:m.252609 g.252609  ORF g.252609 m.252609 type:complete len:1012 (-) comp17189_c0_seq4:35-3070(-)